MCIHRHSAALESTNQIEKENRKLTSVTANYMCLGLRCRATMFSTQVVLNGLCMFCSSIRKQQTGTGSLLRTITVCHSEVAQSTD